jgi:hypothetical protein
LLAYSDALLFVAGSLSQRIGGWKKNLLDTGKDFGFNRFIAETLGNESSETMDLGTLIYLSGAVFAAFHVAEKVMR